jgi:hypothetical protein
LIEPRDAVVVGRRREALGLKRRARLGAAEQSVFRERNGADAGERAEPVHQRDHGAADVVARVSGGNGIDAHHDQPVAVVAHRFRLQVVKRAQKQAACDEQDQRDGDLHGNKRPRAAASAPGRARRVSQDVLKFAAGAKERWRQPKDDTAQQRHCHGKGEDAHVGRQP